MEGEIIEKNNNIENYPCMLKLTPMDESYQCSNFVSDFLMKENLMEFITDVDKKNNPKKLKINVLRKRKKKIKKSYNNKIYKLKKLKTENQKDLNTYIKKLRKLKSNLNIVVNETQITYIKNTIYKLWLLYYKINILDINLLINKTIFRNTVKNKITILTIKDTVYYLLITLLLTFITFSTKYLQNQKKLIKLLNVLLKLIIKNLIYINYKRYTNIFYNNRKLIEKKIKYYFNIVLQHHEDIELMSRNKLNKLELFMKQIRIKTIEDIKQFGESHVFITNVFIDLELYTGIKINTDIPFIKDPPLKKYTLILDLDETLIHFSIKNEKQGKLYFRPYLNDFLNNVSNYFELIVFTAGVKEYAKMVLDVIENRLGKKIFDYRLYREHLSFSRNNGLFIKDLSKIGRDLTKTIIVDNSEDNFSLQKNNGILINSYLGIDKYLLNNQLNENSNDNNINIIKDFKDNDKCLLELEKILLKLINDNPEDLTYELQKYKDEIFQKVTIEQ